MKKRNSIIYWIATLWLSLGMVSTGLGQLLNFKGQGDAEMITHLGYPIYLLTIIGVWKFLGAAALLLPRTPLLKEWTYAGFFFIMTGAAMSHIAVGDPVIALFPSLLLVILTIVSWYFRPADKKINSIQQS